MSDSSSTRMNFLFPLSSLFNSKTACPVVPEPANESKIISSESCSSANVIIRRKSPTGFGLGKSSFPNPNSKNASVPRSEFTSLNVHAEVGLTFLSSPR